MQENKQEKSPIKERILQYLDSKGITKYSFYKESGVSRNILDQNTGISEDNISRFIAYAPDVSVKWLITGQGKMQMDENHEDEKSTKNAINQNTDKIVDKRKASENIFTGDTDKEIEDYIAEAFTQHLLEMYETGRAYPATVVKLMLDEKNGRIKELEKEIKELDRKLYHNSNEEIKKDLF